MSISTKLTNYAPDIYKSLNGILLVYKPPRVSIKDLNSQLRDVISESLNQFEPRPIAKRLQILGEIDEEKAIVEGPNLADHPLVVGPRYLPWELQLTVNYPILNYRSSGICYFLLGSANQDFRRKIDYRKFVNVYHITGKFGYITDNFFSDGKITDKSTYHHIRSGKMDGVLARILSTQNKRIFDLTSVPLDSQEAYELAKTWPLKTPPSMARWPVIYRLRCIHLKLPNFKLEVTVGNEHEEFLAQLTNDVGLMLKSGAFTESIRRIKCGPYKIEDCLTDKDWNLETMIKSLRNADEIVSTYGRYRQDIVNNN